MRPSHLSQAEHINTLASKTTDGIIPDGLFAPEQLLFLSLYYLYKLYRTNKISLDIATTNKDKLFDEYSNRLEQIEKNELLQHVRSYLNQVVSYKGAYYICTGIIDKGNLFQAELTDIKNNNSVCIVRLEEVEL